MKICIVIPTFNERENIRRLIPELESVLSREDIDGRLLIVDDDSPDETGKMAEQFARKFENIEVLHRKAKLGIGSAYKQAFRVLNKQMEIDVVLEMDADFSHDPEAVPELVDMINEGYDVVVGSRYVEGGRIYNWPFRRRMISKGANFLAGRLVDVGINDMTSGFRAYRSSVLDSLDLSKINSDGYAFQVEILYRCKQIGAKIVEIPIIFKERSSGKSKLGNRAIFGFFKTLFRILIERLRKRTGAR